MFHEPIWMAIDASRFFYFSEIWGSLHMVSDFLVTMPRHQGSTKSLLLFLNEKYNKRIYCYKNNFFLL